MGKTSSASKNKWMSKAYDRINLTVPKGQKETIRDAAGAAGQSVNAYIYEAVQDRMARDAHAEAPEPPEDNKPQGGLTPIPNVLYK